MYDVVIVGGGPGGYAAALYAHNFSLRVALVTKERVGGTCLLRGCIPAKTWLQTAEVYATVARAEEFGVRTGPPELDWGAALARKTKVVDGLVRGLSGLLASRKVEVVEGVGRLVPGGVEVTAPDGTTRRLEARTTIVASGSVAATIPGYEVDGERIVTSDHALDWPERPERVAIIGAGAIGAEFASLLGDVGSEVHLFEMEEQILPGMEPEAARILERELKKKGVAVHVGTRVGPAERSPGGVVVPHGGERVEVDVVLVATGRRPFTEGLGLEALGVETDRGAIVVDPATMQSSVPGVYAVGDVVAGTPQLAHVGFAEGIAAITHIATGTTAPVHYDAVPMVVYTHPEVAQVGLTEAEAIRRGHEVTTTTHAMRGVGRAIIKGATSGLVKVVTSRDGQVLGGTIVDPAAGELVHELMYAVGWEAHAAEAAAFIHAHPTVAEAIGETFLAAAGHPLH